MWDCLSECLWAGDGASDKPWLFWFHCACMCAAGHLRLKGTVAVASQQQQGEERGGNGSLNWALKQEATLVLLLLCFYRLNFLLAQPPPLPQLQSLSFMGWIVKILQRQCVTIRTFVVWEETLFLLCNRFLKKCSISLWSLQMLPEVLWEVFFSSFMSGYSKVLLLFQTDFNRVVSRQH